MQEFSSTSDFLCLQIFVALMVLPFKLHNKLAKAWWMALSINQGTVTDQSNDHPGLTIRYSTLLLHTTRVKDKGVKAQHALGSFLAHQSILEHSHL